MYKNGAISLISSFYHKTTDKRSRNLNKSSKEKKKTSFIKNKKKICITLKPNLYSSILATPNSFPLSLLLKMKEASINNEKGSKARKVIRSYSPPAAAVLSLSPSLSCLTMQVHERPGCRVQLARCSSWGQKKEKLRSSLYFITLSLSLSVLSFLMKNSLARYGSRAGRNRAAHARGEEVFEKGYYSRGGGEVSDLDGEDELSIETMGVRGDVFFEGRGGKG